MCSAARNHNKMQEAKSMKALAKPVDILEVKLIQNEKTVTLTFALVKLSLRSYLKSFMGSSQPPQQVVTATVL